MATIKIETVKAPEQPVSNFTYTDLKLDLDFEYTKNNEFLKKKEIKDLKIDYDYSAIRNSIFNLISTTPGERILNPFFGVNLQKFLFLKITESNALSIGKEILQAIAKFEPRVRVKNINVATDEGNQQYVVTLDLVIVAVPTSGSFRLVGTLSTSGFFFNN